MSTLAKKPSNSDMQLFSVVKEYVNKLIPRDKSMKVLLVDRDTLRIIAVAYSQSELLERGVFLVDQLSNPQRKKMPTMRCVVFVRPVKSALQHLREELKEGRYSGYHLGFANAMPMDYLDILARADEHELVTKVEEYFADYVVVNSDCLTVPLVPNHLSTSTMGSDNFTRIAHGLTAACLSLRRKPLIRYQSSSQFATRVAQEVVATMKLDQELYDFSARDCVLLIVDRAADPVTPLLSPWTYQAMLHNYMGISDNKVTLPDSKPEDAFCFSQADDIFFSNNMFSNWGDLLMSVKKYADDCKSAMNLDKSTATMEEIKAFMAKLPQTKSMTNQVTKHVNCATHLSELLKKRNMMELSVLEQDIVNTHNPSEHLARLKELLPNITNLEDKLRLCMLYNIRYEKSSQGSKVGEFLADGPYSHMLQKLREYYGENKSVEPLFGSSGVMGSVLSFVKGMKDVDNVYTQHEPLLKKQLQEIAGGRLSTEQYPYIGSSSSGSSAPAPTYKPKDVIVFFTGGATYEEACLANAINNNIPQSKEGGGGGSSTGLGLRDQDNIRVVLGGTSMLNCAQFLESLDSLI